MNNPDCQAGPIDKTNICLQGHEGIIFEEPCSKNGSVFRLQTKLIPNDTYHGSFVFAKIVFENLVHIREQESAQKEANATAISFSKRAKDNPLTLILDNVYDPKTNSVHKVRRVMKRPDNFPSDKENKTSREEPV